MSVFASPGDPYWLSSRGVNAVQFNKNATPPLAYVDKGILYEMDDGKLYYNGSAIAPVAVGDVTGPASAIDKSIAVYDGTTGKVIGNTSIVATDKAIQIPAQIGPDTGLWNSSTYALMNGARAMENFCSQCFYVAMNGRAADDGATGDIADPFNNILDAMGRPIVATKNGAVINTTGQFTDPILLLPNVVMNGEGISPMTVLGDISCLNPLWNTPSPFFFNQSFIRNSVLVGAITLDTAGMDHPLLAIENCSVQGSLTAGGDNPDGQIVILNSLLSAPINLTNITSTIIGTGIAVGPSPPATVNIVCDGLHDMTVLIDGLSSSSATINITHAALVNTLTVKIVGYFPGAVNVLGVGFAGGLVLYYDDCQITWSPGTLANTTVNLIKHANTVEYDYGVVPANNVQSAIDYLGMFNGDVVGPAGATDNAICRFDLATGKLIQNSTVLVTDSGLVQFSGDSQLARGADTILAVNGSTNVVVGRAGPASTIGDANVIVGSNSAANLVSAGPLDGSNNCILGSDSAGSLTHGYNNIIIGHAAGTAITTGYGNFIMGNNDTTLTVGTNNIIINGYAAGGADDNSIVIGGQSNGTGSLVIGSVNITSAQIFGIDQVAATSGSSSVRINTDETLAVAYSLYAAFYYFENYGAPYVPNLVVSTNVELRPSGATLVRNDTSGFNSIATGRVSWTKTATNVMMADATVVFRRSVVGGANNILFSLGVNGSVVAGTQVMATTSSTNDYTVCKISGLVTMATGQYVSIFASNQTSSDDIDVGNMSIRLTSLYRA